jgi:hypothetical protein
MDSASLRSSATCPEDLGGPLTALWYGSRGEFDKAHRHIVDEESTVAAWVRAHLHRAAGEGENAAYWYGKAGKSTTDAPLDQEWHEIASALMLMR